MVDMVAGGIEHSVEVVPINWEKGAINATEFPPLPKHFTRPIQVPQPDSAPERKGSEQSDDDPEDDMIHFSRRVLFELCTGIEPASIPQDIKDALTSWPKTARLPLSTLLELLRLSEEARPIISRPHPYLGETNHNTAMIGTTTLMSAQTSNTGSDNASTKGFLEKDKGKSVLEREEGESVPGTSAQNLGIQISFEISKGTDGGRQVYG